MTFTFCSFSTSQMTDTHLCCLMYSTHLDMWESASDTSSHCRVLTWHWSHITAIRLHMTEITEKRNDCRPLIQASVTSSDKNQSTWVECLKIELKDVFPAWICPRGATNLFHYAVERFWAADVETDEHSIGVGIGQGPHVVIVWRS